MNKWRILCVSLAMSLAMSQVSLASIFITPFGTTIEVPETAETAETATEVKTEAAAEATTEAATEAAAETTKPTVSTAVQPSAAYSTKDPV